jgi:hypothetical protein
LRTAANPASPGCRRPPSKSAHGILLIVPGREIAATVWRDAGIGNWAAAFPLRLERAGLLDFEVADERALDEPSELADRDLVVVASLPDSAWTESRRRNLRSASGGVFLEGPIPSKLSGAEPARTHRDAPAIAFADGTSEVISLDLPLPQTRPMRLDPSLAPRAPDTGLVLPPPPPTDGIEAGLAPAEAWYRGPDMGTAFADAPGDVLARRPADGAAMIMRDGHICFSSTPLLGWLGRAYAAPPLEGPFLNRPMRHVKRLEARLFELLLGLAAEAGRPLLRVAPWPAGKTFACTLAHDVDRIPKPADFDRLLGWERRMGLKSSWYWIHSRLDPARIEQIGEAGFEIGLHAILAARKRAEIVALAAVAPAPSSIRGETLHGGAGGDHWRGAASVLHAHAAGLAYTEHCPTAHDLPDTGFAVLRDDGDVEPVSIIGLTHAVCLERNPVKEEEVYHRESLDRLAAAGGYCLVSNHPDRSFDGLCEWIEGLPLGQAWHATAAEIAAWWRASHDRSALAVSARRNTGDDVEITVTARDGVTGLVLRLPITARTVTVHGGRLVAHPPGEALIAVDVPAGETRTVHVSGCDRPRRVAIVRPAGISAARQALGSAADDARLVHLCYHGRHFDPARAVVDNPAFLLAPLDPPVDSLLVLPQTPGLFPNAFTTAWLGTLLVRGETREILVGRGGGARGRQIENALRSALPATAIDEADSQWLRLHPGAGLGEHIAALPTAYPFLHGSCRRFRDLYAIARHRDAGNLVAAGNGEGPAEASYKYSMIGASRNSLMLERLADRFGWGPQPTMLDVGGGHGFLGLELAAKGWTVTVADHDPAKTELLGPWLARLSPRRLAIEYCSLSMEDLAAGGIPGQPSGFHAVTFFGSLLFARRNRVASLLRACWERLVPGGALIVREMVRQTAGEHLHGFRFERDELLRLVAENAAPPGFISIVDGSPMTEFHAGTSALLVAKPGGGASLWRSSDKNTSSGRAEHHRNGDTG